MAVYRRLNHPGALWSVDPGSPISLASSVTKKQQNPNVWRWARFAAGSPAKAPKEHRLNGLLIAVFDRPRQKSAQLFRDPRGAGGDHVACIQRVAGEEIVGPAARFTN